MTAQTPDQCFYKGKIYYPFYPAKRYYTEKTVLSFLTDDWDNPMLGDYDIPKSRIDCSNLHRKRVGHFQLHDDLRLQIHAISQCPKVKDDNQWLEWKQTHEELDESRRKDKQYCYDWIKRTADAPPLYPGMFDIMGGNVFKEPTFIDYHDVYLFDNPLYYSINLYETKWVLHLTEDGIKKVKNPWYKPTWDKESPLYYKKQEKKKTFWQKLISVFSKNLT